MGGPGSGRKAREYPQEVVELICSLYIAGKTVAEIRAIAPKGYRVQTVLERYLPERRVAAKRYQSGSDNHMWRGEDAGYQAAHLRLASRYGKARDYVCAEECGETAAEWSYEGGCPEERRDQHGSPYCMHSEHYRPRCRQCHRQHDRKESANA